MAPTVAPRKTLSDLPKELILQIISEFNLSDRTSFSAICRRFYKLEQEACESAVKEDRDELWLISRDQGRSMDINVKSPSNNAPKLRVIRAVDPSTTCFLLRRIFRSIAFKKRVIVRIYYNNADHHPIVDTLSCCPRYSNDVLLVLYHEDTSGPIDDVSVLLKAISSGFREVRLPSIAIHTTQILRLYQGIIHAQLESLIWHFSEETMNGIAEQVMGVRAPDSITTTRCDGNVYCSQEGISHLILYHGGIQSTLWMVDKPYLCMERSNNMAPEGETQYLQLTYAAP